MTRLYYFDIIFSTLELHGGSHLFTEASEASKVYIYTLFENYSKCRICIFLILAFPTNFCSIKLTCLVTLFDHKLHVLKNSPN